MPGDLRIRVAVEVGELSRDLRAMGADLDKPLREAFDKGSQMVADTAKVLMRYRAEGAWKGSSGADYTHIRDYYSHRANRQSGVVESEHPAAPVWEWGGTIHPLLGDFHHALAASRAKEGLRQQLHAADRDRPPWTFRIPRLQPVGDAGQLREPEIERVLDDAVARLIRQYGF